MLELPEVTVLAQQLNENVYGKKVANVIVLQSPHKFAWFCEDPQKYSELLTGKSIGQAAGYGAMLEIKVEDAVLVFSDGVNLRFHRENEKRPQKHQLLLEFDDLSALSASVQMYGGLWAFRNGEFDNIYYQQAKEKPSPLTDRFDKTYFNEILSKPEVQKLSVKAFLATEQRIPGLGNGVLQDILFNAKIHPKRKFDSLTETELDLLFNSVKNTLTEMTAQGGRDTEKDLFGSLGGYRTKLSKKSIHEPCSICGSMIKKQSYLGGSIYFCEGCQEL